MWIPGMLEDVRHSACTHPAVRAGPGPQAEPPPPLPLLTPPGVILRTGCAQSLKIRPQAGYYGAVSSTAFGPAVRVCPLQS